LNRAHVSFTTRPNVKEVMPPIGPLLSIVITGFTMARAHDLAEGLRGVKDQTYSSIETLVIVEKSKKLFEYTKRFVDSIKLDKVQILFIEKEAGMSGGRNLGIENARGDIIAFVDDDAKPFPTWAQQMVTTYEDSSIIGVMGGVIPSWEEKSMNWFPEEFYWLLGCTASLGLNDITDVRNVWGTNMSFRREAFDKCGSFTATFGLQLGGSKGWHDPPSEDVDFSLRVRRATGKRIVFNPFAQVAHKITKDRFRWRFIVRRACSVGYQRRMIKTLYTTYPVVNLLGPEHDLLKRILSRLVPRTLKILFKKPRIALRTFLLTIVILLSVTLGYMLP